MQNISRREVSIKSGISYGYYWRIEMGRAPRPNIQSIYFIATALNLKLSELFARCGVWLWLAGFREWKN